MAKNKESKELKMFKLDVQKTKYSAQQKKSETDLFKAKQQALKKSSGLFGGGKEVGVSSIKKFASSGSSELHAKGNFSDMKKRFGRFE